MSNQPDDVIIPPPEVRSMIEKTAQYVARHGSAFENKIKAKEAQNPKFLFINKNDPYNGFYKQTLNALKNNGAVRRINEPKKALPDIPIVSEDVGVKLIVDPDPFHTLSIKNGELVDIEKEMTLSDLNTLKLMAKYVVQYGPTTIETLKGKIAADEDLRPHFAFLQPTDRFHLIYLKYIEAYTLIITKKERLIKSIEQFVTLDSWKQNDFMEECYKLSEQVETIQQSRKSLEKEKNDRLLAYASIDWQEFEIVETVEFTDADTFEKPLTKESLKYRSLIMREANKHFRDDSDVANGIPDDASEEDEIPLYDQQEEGEATEIEKAEEETPKLKAPKGMKIRSAGDSRLKRRNMEVSTSSSGGKFLICPLSGKQIAESEFQAHISTLLRDPKYEVEKERYEAKFKYGDNLTSTQAWENINALVNENRDSKRFKKN